MLRDFITHLPPESATMTALRNARPEPERGGGDPAEAPWSQMEILIAALVDEIRCLRHDYTVTHLAKGKRKPKEPEPIPRPGLKARGAKKRKLTTEQTDILFRHINGLPQPDGVQFELIKGGGEG